MYFWLRFDGTPAGPLAPAGVESGPSSWAKPASYTVILARSFDVSNTDMVAPGHPKDVDD